MAAERINHAGRILGTQATVNSPILFNTAAADAVVSTLQIMPTTNPWNERVDSRQVHASSAAIMARISSDLGGNQDLRCFYEMNYVLVPNNQALVDVKLVDYPDESDDVVAGTDRARYPFPDNTPVEGWPASTGGMSLADHQRDINDEGGDRHSISVQPGTGKFWETWHTTRNPSRTPAWWASNGARFDLTTNTLRPDGWTSGDAAGLPMFPALVRYDEVQRGEIEHALRMIVKKTRRDYIYPATHFASSLNDSNLPVMGQRLRLKASVGIPSGWSKESKAVAVALKRYGALIADNGAFMSISVTPDNRWPADCFEDLRDLDIADFEVIQSTGPNEGPRSAGAPTVSVGPALTTVPNSDLAITSSGAGGTLTWSLYRYDTPPGTATFANSHAASTTVRFSAPGVYRVMCSRDDGIHAPAWAALQVTVVGSLTERQLRVTLSDADGGLPGSVRLDGGDWHALNAAGQATLPSTVAEADHLIEIGGMGGDG
jgi:hypothetical protein